MRLRWVWQRGSNKLLLRQTCLQHLPSKTFRMQVAHLECRFDQNELGASRQHCVLLPRAWRAWRAWSAATRRPASPVLHDPAAAQPVNVPVWRAFHNPAAISVSAPGPTTTWRMTMCPSATPEPCSSCALLLAHAVANTFDAVVCCAAGAVRGPRRLSLTGTYCCSWWTACVAAIHSSP